jgi:hypothetical protein
LNRKLACLFFDQINNYANFRSASHLGWMPSTDLSTVIVDKYVQWDGLWVCNGIALVE